MERGLHGTSLPLSVRTVRRIAFCKCPTSKVQRSTRDRELGTREYSATVAGGTESLEEVSSRMSDCRRR